MRFPTHNNCLVIVAESAEKEPKAVEKSVEPVALDRELPWKCSSGAAICDPHSVSGRPALVEIFFELTKSFNFFSTFNLKIFAESFMGAGRGEPYPAPGLPPSNQTEAESVGIISDVKMKETFDV